MESSPNMATRVAQQPVIMFDTHAYVRHMCQGGFSEKQAEASADALTDAFRGAVVTQDVLKSELLVCRDEFRGEIQEVRGEIQEVHEKIQEVRDEFRSDMQEFRDEVQGEFKAVRGEIQEVNEKIQEVRGEIIKSENKLIYAMGAGFVSMAALMVVLFKV